MGIVSTFYTNKPTGSGSLLLVIHRNISTTKKNMTRNCSFIYKYMSEVFEKSTY